MSPQPSSVWNSVRRTKEVASSPADQINYRSLIEADEPVILRGALSDRPLVQAGLESDRSAIDHLANHYSGAPLLRYSASPDAGGRFFYNQSMTGMNFQTDTLSLEAFWQDLKDVEGTGAARFVGSTDIHRVFPGLFDDNRLNMVDVDDAFPAPTVNLWMGNKTTTAAHFDMTHNIACCMAGRRRFTLFPPNQVGNLYPGPLEPTPGGQVVSLVDFDQPNFDKHPKFADAHQHAEIADLSPGDVLVYPAMWWHQVESLAAFNILINIWWNDAPAFMDSPMNTLLHGLLSLRGRSLQERKAWRDILDFYLFEDTSAATEHLPEQVQGPLANLDAMSARRLRAMLLHKINR